MKTAKGIRIIFCSHACLLLVAFVFKVFSAASFAQGVIIFPTNNCVTPANDMFANARVLQGNQFLLTNDLACATSEPAEPIFTAPNFTRSVWYRWTPDHSGIAHLQLLPDLSTNPIYSIPIQNPPSGNFDLAIVVIPYEPPSTTRLDVYEGVSLDSLQSLTLTNSRFDFVRGETYYLDLSDSTLVISPSPSDVAIFNLRAEGLKLNSNMASIPNAGTEEYEFEIAPIDQSETLTNVIVSLAGVPFATNTSAPFVFHATSVTNGNVPVTAIAQTIDGRTLNLFDASLQFRPSNDDFADAAQLPDMMLGQPQNYSAINATLEPNEPNDFGATNLLPTVWWRWTPTHSAPTSIQPLDSPIAIYKGSALTNLELVMAVKPSPISVVVFAWGGSFPLQDTVFTNEANVTYWIAATANNQTSSWTMVQHFNSASIESGRVAKPIEISLSENSEGVWPDLVDVQIQGAQTQFPFKIWTNIDDTITALPRASFHGWTPTSVGGYQAVVALHYSEGVTFTQTIPFLVRPQNDDFADAIDLPGDAPPSLTPSFQYASAEANEPPFGTNPPSSTLWWRWTPLTNTAIRLRMATSFQAYPVDVFQGESLNTLTRVANNDGRTGSEFFEGWVPLNAVAGQTYYIRAEAPADPTFLSYQYSLVSEPLDAPIDGLILLTTVIGSPNSTGAIDWQPFGKIYAPDGSYATNLNFSARFFCGLTLDRLAPAGIFPPAVNNGSSDPVLAGTLTSGLNKFGHAGDTLLVQLRAWDATKGWTYEDARAAGGATGHSQIASVVLGSELSGPSYPTNIGDVHLALPATPFQPASLSSGDLHDQSIQIYGTPGLYVIESTDFTGPWTTFQIVTNIGETTSIFLPPPTNRLQFYRSRLID